MQKKVLIPLLMAGTATVPALADINIGFPQSNKWTQSGATGNENPWSQDKVSGYEIYTNVLGTGEVSTKVPLPMGTFRLSFESVDNILVLVDGKNVEATYGTNAYEFKVETAGEVSIVIKPKKENAQFSFTSKNLELVISGQDVATRIEALRNDILYIGFKEVAYRDFYPQAEELRNEKETLENLSNYYVQPSSPWAGDGITYDQVIADIQSLDNGLTLDESLAIYNKYKLYDADNAPALALKNLADRQATYNEKVDAENAVWDVYLANIAKYEELKKAQESLLSNDSNSVIDCDQLKAEIDAWQVVDDAVKANLNSELAELRTQIEAYGNAIDAAFFAPEFEDTALREAIDFTSQESALAASLANLQSQLKDGISNYDVYYNVNYLLMDKLEEAYNNYESTIYHPEAVEREKIYGNDVYADIVLGGFRYSPYLMSLQEAEELKNQTKENCQIPNVAGATEYNNTNKCAENIQKAIDQLLADAEDFKNLVTEQDANMVDAQAEIKGLNERLDKYKGYTVPNDDKDRYQALLEEVENYITNLTGYVGREYPAHTLNLADGSYYANQLYNINDLFNELSIIVGPVAIINDLQKMLDDAKAKVVQVSSLEELAGIVNVASKFDGTFVALQQAINDIDTQEEANAAVEMAGGVYVDGCLADEILKTVDNAEAMALKFKDANQVINAFENGDENLGYGIGLAQVKEIVENKGIVDAKIVYGNPEKSREHVTVPEVENAKKAYDFSPYEQAIAAYRLQLADAAAADNQEAWQLINALNDALWSEMYGGSIFGGWGGSMQSEWKHFVVDCTAFNKEYAHNLYEALKLKKAEAEDAMVTNIGSVKFNDIEKALEDADAKQKNLSPTAFNPMLNSNANAVDELYKKALAAIYVQEDKVNDLVANQDAFKALTVKLQASEDLLAGFREYNETNSVTPGKEFFEGKIEEIEEKLNDLAVELTKSVEGETAVEKTNEFNNKIAAINDEINTTWAADKTNNRVHNDQLALEKEVRTYIEDLIAMITADENKQDLAVVTEWLNTLNGLLSTDMVQANNNVTNAYGEGLSEAMNEQITAEYNRIKNVAIEINKVYGDELHRAVVDANTDTTAAWPVLMVGLDNLYRDGIRSYNYFYYELTNAGWREYVSEAIRRHQSLFQYYDKIKTLNEEEAAYVAAQNQANHVITAAEWAEWTGKYEAMAADIERDVRAMVDEMNSLGESYYAEKHTAATEELTEAEAALTAAGIDTKYLDPAKDYLHEAEFEKWRVENKGTDLSFAMDDIADILDQIIPAIDVQAYAQKAWADVYAAAEATIDDLREELGSYEFADALVKADQIKIFNKNVSDAITLNNTATYNQDLVNFYKSYCETLQGYLDNMAAAVAKVKESNDLNVENKQIYDDFTTWYNGVGADLDALRAYCNAMAGCYGKQGMVDALQAQLDALKAFVDTHKGTLNENNIPGRIADFDAAVLGAYAEAAYAEKAYLLRQIDKTKVAYNDAYQKHATLPEGYTYEGVNEDIREIDGGVAVLAFDAADKEAFKDAAVQYEKDLADIYNMLQNSWTENPAAGVLSALEARYTTISESIANAKNFLEGCMPEVKAKYPEAYKVYEDALNAERAAWQGEGAHVIDREPFHNSVLDKIQREVSDLAGEINVAEQKAQAEAEKIRVSEARYEVLKAQYDALVEEFDTAKATVAGYENGISDNLKSQANNIQRMLDTALSNLNSARQSHSLTNYSQLTYGNEIDAAIDKYVLDGATQLATLELNKAVQAGREASTALTTLSIVPADRMVLNAEYNTANSKLQSLLDEKNRANVARLNAIAEEARDLVEKFNSILERAQDSAYVLGNVDMDEDNEVTAVDVQYLINLIGEGETYETLYAANPRQACAADVAGNKVLDIADVTALIQMIMGDEPQVLKVRARIPGVAGDDHLTIAFMGEEEGVRRYALSLTNTTEFIGAQFDIKTSGNARIVGMSPAERTAGHDVYMFENIDGARAVMASMENAVFAGNDGIVMYVDVEGKGELTVNKAVFADKDNVAHLLDKAHTSSIDAIIDGFKDGASRIYDAAGRAYNRLQKGINIIRHKDGTVTKEMHK